MCVCVCVGGTWNGNGSYPQHTWKLLLSPHYKRALSPPPSDVLQPALGWRCHCQRKMSSGWVLFRRKCNFLMAVRLVPRCRRRCPRRTSHDWSVGLGLVPRRKGNLKDAPLLLALCYSSCLLGFLFPFFTSALQIAHACLVYVCVCMCLSVCLLKDNNNKDS